MKKMLSLLLLAIALLPGCGFWCRKAVVAPKTQPVYRGEVVVGTGSAQQIQPAEEISAFELQEDENPFNTAVQLHSVGDVTEVVYEQVDTVASNTVACKNIYYDFDQYDIRKDQQAVLSENAAKLKSVAPNEVIVIEGHACDSAGSDKYNIILSEKRAEKVADRLAEKGIDRQKIRTVGRGSEMRIVPAGDREQQAPNRRVELHVLPTHTA